jgi:sodium/pantothenate symporter
MRIFELVWERPVIWAMFLVYLAAIVGLAAAGRRRARRDARSFAIGKVHPVVAGMTLAASIASTATFVINPGFVYVHGLSALMHFGVASGLGIACGLIVVCGRFRRQGAAGGAVTLPQWIGQRYGSRGLRVLFAGLNLLSLCFVVLIVGGLSIVMQRTLGLSNTESLLVVTIFVFGYVMLGGAYANAYANTLQAAIMAVVAVMIVGSGLAHLGDGLGAVAERLRAVDPHLASPVNPASALFGSWWSVYACGFVIGFALMCQPHIMATALYVDGDRAVRRAVAVGIAFSVVFASVLLAGLWAHLAGLPREAITDPATGAILQDRIMTVYLAETFSPPALALVTVALLAAGMSTMSAILVALSSIAANDLVPRSRDPRRASRWILVALGLLVLAIAHDPPRLLGIFGQLGVYGLVSAAAAPVVLGVLAPALDQRGALAAALVGPTVHFGLYFGTDIANPAVSATLGILAAATVAGLRVWTRSRVRTSACDAARPAGRALRA